MHPTHVGVRIRRTQAPDNTRIAAERLQRALWVSGKPLYRTTCFAHIIPIVTDPADDIATALDPSRLFGAAGLTPDDWQARVLRGSWQRLLMLCSRQAGKSTTVAALAAHEAVYDAGSLTLMTAPSQRQAKETLAKFWDFYRALQKPVEVDAKSELRVRFANGSRVIALPGTEKTIRGYSGVDLLILDEAARIPDALYSSVRPMLAVSGGRLAALTTPHGQRGWFYEAWTAAEAGEEDWERVRITWRDCPRIPKTFIDAERRSVGRWWIRQEYETEFVDAEDQFFRGSDIDAAAAHDFEPLFGAHSAAESDAAGSDPAEDDAFDPIPLNSARTL